MQVAAALAIFIVAFILIASERVSKVLVVLVGAALMAVLGLVPGAKVFFSEHEGIDWNVIFLLLGMMIIVGVLRQTGLFEYLGIWAAKKSKAKPFRLMVMLMTITAVASPILDNVTIIMLIVPVTIVVAERLDVSPAPYIIAEVLASNIGGASTLIGDPPNIIIASRAGLSFMDFIEHMMPIVIVIFVVFVALSRILFRKSFAYHPERLEAIMVLNEKRAIANTAQLVRCLIVLGLVIVAFCLHSVLHADPSIIALVGALVMVLVSGVDMSDIVPEVEWPTLVFFAGLFVLVGGLVHTGVIATMGQWAVDAIGTNYFAASTVLLFGSAVLGAFFDNIPYAATMAPIVEALVQQAADPASVQHLWWSFALGADFGGNGTAIAASANVVAIGLAARAGHKITFWQFTKYGIPVTLLSTAMAWGYVALRYF